MGSLVWIALAIIFVIGNLLGLALCRMIALSDANRPEAVIAKQPAARQTRVQPGVTGFGSR